MTSHPADPRTPSGRILPPEPDLTPDELIRRAAALRPMLVERQAEVEERTYYGDDVHRELQSSGIYRLLVPRRYGRLRVRRPNLRAGWHRAWTRLRVDRLVRRVRLEPRVTGRHVLRSARGRTRSLATATSLCIVHAGARRDRAPCSGRRGLAAHREAPPTARAFPTPRITSRGRLPQSEHPGRVLRARRWCSSPPGASGRWWKARGGTRWG